MKAYYCDHFVLPLPPGHRFPMRKYSRLREMILEHGIVAPDDLCVPEAATDEQILRCHDNDYLENVKHGRLSAHEIRRIGFPWSPEMVERSRRSVGGTIAACLSAFEDGISVNLAGGTHHACRDHGEGFCIFNDVAIAARDMQVRDMGKRVVIIDCDVHQGNGTAQITAHDSSIFTFSIHGEKNFPFRKIDSDLDIGLPDGITDAQYLDLVEEGTRRALFLSGADLAIYLSGADPYEGDRLGKLMISKRGLALRDELVLNLARQAGLPVAVVMGGGYAHNVEDIAAIHLETVRIASLMVSA
jgi:acetoin utilization deacetylase AcuC-like enzyme